MRPWELRLAALALGARRLGALAELEVELDPVSLPVHDRFVRVSNAIADNAEHTGDDSAGRLSLRSRTLPREALRRAQRQAAALLVRLAAQNRRQPLSAAVAGISSLVAPLVESEAERQALLAPLVDLSEAAQASRTVFEVTAAEAALLLRDAWSGVASAPLGGRGGGVALLSVTEARGRTFRRLVLGGLARDRFPRAVRADPFLPDSLRLRLRDLLPDLPVKSEGHDEERFLFAQLLGAATDVALFSSKADEEGKPLSPSSFLDELRRAGRIGEALPAADPGRPRRSTSPAGRRSKGRPRRSPRPSSAPTAKAKSASRPTPRRRPRLRDGAASHLALLAELGADPSAPRAAALGPFFGFVGARPGAEGAPARPPGAPEVPYDPRRLAPAVTTLQGLAGCGWRTFLGKLLRLVAPLAGEDEIPELPNRLTGTVVHAVLERMAPPALGEVRRLTDAAAHAGMEVLWPDASALQLLIATATREALTAEGLDAELFALPLELAAGEALAVVERLDWPGGGRPLLGLEVDGEADLDLPSGGRTVTFRADRVEIAGEGFLLTDYKTGKTVVSDGAKAETRERHLEKALSQGEWLQLPAYARARTVAPVEGRLLFLKSDLADDRRDVRLAAPAAGSLAEATERTVWQTLFTAWERGAFLPRLLDGTLEESSAECAYCDVRVACVQGDSGARLRLERWARARLEGGSPPPSNDLAEPAEDAAWRLFQLKSARPPAAAPEES